MAEPKNLRPAGLALMQTWRESVPTNLLGGVERELWLMQRAATHQFDVCRAWLAAQDQSLGSWIEVKDFEAACRPKPPSLKERALEAARIELNPNGPNGALIIQALKALPEDAG